MFQRHAEKFDVSLVTSDGLLESMSAQPRELMLRRALDEFVLDGVETTLPLFRALVREPDILNGDYHIHWLEQFLAKSAAEE